LPSPMMVSRYWGAPIPSSRYRPSPILVWPPFCTIASVGKVASGIGHRETIIGKGQYGESVIGEGQYREGYHRGGSISGRAVSGPTKSKRKMRSVESCQDPRKLLTVRNAASPCTIARVRGPRGAIGQWISTRIGPASPQCTCDHRTLPFVGRRPPDAPFGSRFRTIGRFPVFMWRASTHVITRARASPPQSGYPPDLQNT